MGSGKKTRARSSSEMAGIICPHGWVHHLSLSPIPDVLECHGKSGLRLTVFGICKKVPSTCAILSMGVKQRQLDSEGVHS